MDISGCGASISEKIARKFTHINSSGPSFAISVTKKIILTQFHALQNRKPVQWPHYEIRPTFDEKHRAKATSTGRDTPQRAGLSNTKMEITCLMFWEVIIGSYFLWKILSEFNRPNVFCLIFQCLLPHIEGS